jgi:pimeloyl-ACP methyl ester carboxylesterase
VSALPTTGSIELDGVRWAYAEHGSGPLVLFFHGTLAGKQMFARQVEALSDRYRCVAFDWPGHGDSGYDPAGWTVPDLVDAVPRLIAALGEPAAVLVGLSQGGACSLRVALDHPERVLALVTMGAGPDGPAREAAAGLAQLGLTLRDGADDERRAVVEELQRGFFHAPGWVDDHPDDAEAELALILSHDRDAMPLATRIPASYDTVEGRLKGVACPSLVIWGADDVRADWGPRMVALMPDARLLTLPDCGHHVALDQPLATTAALSVFLDDLRLG